MLPQEPIITDHHSILDYVLSGDDEISITVGGYEHALISEKEEDLQPWLEKMEALNAWDFESQAKQILGKLGIHDLSIPADTLSGGQQKRVALAKLLIEQPDLLLLDEPTAGMSARETNATIELIVKIVKGEGLTLLFTEHDMSMVFSISERILILHQGKLIAAGLPEEVRKNPEVRNIYFGETK